MAEWVWVPIIVIGFLLISLYLGIRGGTGSSATTADHVVAGRKLGLLLLFASPTATHALARAALARGVDPLDTGGESSKR